MPYNTVFLSIRVKLDDVIKDEILEKQIIENVRYCRRVVGKEFKIIFWNKDLNENQVKEFVKRNNEILFEINTEITKEFNLAWFVIGEEDESKHRYLYTGNILEGIGQYLQLSKVLIKKMKDERY
jgi:hypothetical protein|tara:strand:+ start:1533 stop:1907 length:375 start_codon:yes stop_codon:yes gene_type:complete